MILMKERFECALGEGAENKEDDFRIRASMKRIGWEEKGSAKQQLPESCRSL